MSEVKLLTIEELNDVRDRLLAASNGRGSTMISISSSWDSQLSWARNSPSMTSDRRDVVIFVARNIKRTGGGAATNQTDDVSLRNVMRVAEDLAMSRAELQKPDDHAFPVSRIGSEGPATTWSDDTLNRSVEESSRLIHTATLKARDGGLMSAGYLENKAFNVLAHGTDEFGRVNPDLTGYGEMTQIQCSVTVRDPKGSASGWAGKSSYSIADVNELAIAELALDKAVRSMNAVRVEPGRYTVVLEPQATADLVDIFLMDTMSTGRRYAESRRYNSPMWFQTDENLPRERSKLGTRIVDPRVTISHTVRDPELGVIPVAGVRDITLIEKGVLKELYSDRGTMLNEANIHRPNIERRSYRMEGGNSTTEEMISSTRRGFLVTRFSNLNQTDRRSLLASGVTRDGLWLIEDGKVTKSVKNFRLSESPLFALNNLEELGREERVFHPFTSTLLTGLAPQYALSQVIVPSLKIRDFSFTSTIDAI